ncbi:hypothetical protein ACFYXS_18595 [Streptomyces sp. NPDC002574]|uniref:hypothetical protein n=1 Tax=Streptomyces sp. NPDC002574 TaxID=3364652 RepID=UPI0036C4CBB0
MRTHAFTFVLAPALLAVLTACSGSSQPTTTPESDPPRAAAATHSPTVVGAATVPMPDVIGGNVQGALDQLGPDADVRITDAGGQHREIEDPSTWKICTAAMDPGPVYRFGAVMTNEHC